MLSRAITPKRKGRSWLTALATLSLLVGTLAISSSSLALTQSVFELDKNATNDLVTVHLGASKSAIKSTAATTSFINCEIVGVTYPTAPFTILIDSELMTVTSYGATTTATGGCSFNDPALVASQTRVYNVTRPNRAAHPGGSDVTQMITSAVPTDADDWDDVWRSVTADTDDEGADDQCIALGAVECAWIHDGFNTSVFTGGSKDDLDIDQWGHTDSSVPPSDEILDAFAAKYESGGSEFLFFGADRWSTNGAKDFGFWFFKNEVVAEPDGTFGEALHSVGDILILGTFSQGGAVATIRVFSWAGLGLGDTNGVLNTEGSFGDCSIGGGTGPGCNTVNDTTIPSPWAYQGAGSTQVPGVIYSGGFIEGGIDLTTLGLTGCFSSFMAETRSSPSVSAQLKDLVLGTFESCEASIATDASDDSFEIGGSITDDATVTVSGPAPEGFVDFYLCGPEDGIATCDATGTAISSEDLADAVVDGDDYTVTSDSVTPASAGDYCFYAEYPADQDDNYPDGAFPIDSINECFEVTPKQPEISTQVDDAGPLDLGSSLDDTATLGNTATPSNGVGGTITFTAYGPEFDTTTCTTLVYTSVVDVTGDGDYVASSGTGGVFTPTEAGTYNWIAAYAPDAGDANNLPVSGACGDANEGSLIPQQPTISTQVNTEDPVSPGDEIFDTATLGNTATPSNGLGGTITFTAYGPEADASTCNTVAYTSVVDVTGDGDYVSNTGTGGAFAPIDPGFYNWIAVYAPDAGDANNLGATTACGDAHEGSIVELFPPEQTTAQTWTVFDTMTITVAGGGDLLGTAHFALYRSATCAGTAIVGTVEDVAVSGPSGTSVSTTPFTFTASEPILYWSVSYESDNPKHADIAASCTENSVLEVNN